MKVISKFIFCIIVMLGIREAQSQDGLNTYSLGFGVAQVEREAIGAAYNQCLNNEMKDFLKYFTENRNIRNVRNLQIGAQNFDPVTEEFTGSSTVRLRNRNAQVRENIQFDTILSPAPRELIISGNFVDQGEDYTFNIPGIPMFTFDTAHIYASSEGSRVGEQDVLVTLATNVRITPPSSSQIPYVFADSGQQVNGLNFNAGRFQTCLENKISELAANSPYLNAGRRSDLDFLDHGRGRHDSPDEDGLASPNAPGGARPY